MKPRKASKTPRPGVRIPLPRQVGGPHEDRTRRPARKAKHRKRWREEQ